MRSERRLAVTAAALVAVAGCGGQSTSATSPRERPASTQDQARTSQSGCPAGISVRDGAHDLRDWVTPKPANAPAPPVSADLRRFELSSGPRGICTRWTFASTPRPGLELQLVIHGPIRRIPAGGEYSAPYGFTADLSKTGARLTFGVSSDGSPNVVDGTVTRHGKTVTVEMSRAELDRAPLGGAIGPRPRPPFPYRRFAFEARAITAMTQLVKYVDFAPNSGEVGYISGKLCPYPCMHGGVPVSKRPG